MSSLDSSDIITLLHVSDFHFTRRKQRDQKIVVDALLRDLKTKCVGYRKPDLIMFTGDLVHAGGVDRHDEAYDFLLAKISASVGLNDERIFIAPGNHDVNTSIVDKHEVTHTEWRSICDDQKKLNEAHEKGEFDKLTQEKLETYFELEQYLNDGTKAFSSPFGTVHRIKDLELEVIIFNTSTFSKGGSKSLPKDEGYMAIPEFSILELCDQLTGKFCIAVTHHPLSSLSESSAKILRHNIQLHANLHLFGHMHDPEAENIQGLNGTVHASQSGAIYTHRTDYYIGYSLISLSRNSGASETLFRTYFPDRDSFDTAVDRVPGGIFYPNRESRDFWKTQVSPFDETELKAHLNEIGPVELFLNRDCAEDEREILEQFVAPPIIRQFSASELQDDGATIRPNQDVTIDDLLSAGSNEIIVAAPEHGRTMLLRHLQYLIFTNQGESPDLPIFIDFGDLKSNLNAALRIIRANASTLPNDVSVEGLMTSGYCTILVDDVDFKNQQKLKILKEIIVKYPRVRYILSAPKGDLLAYGSISVPEMPLHFGALEVCPLRRKQMRQLVKKFSPGANQEVLLEKLHSEFSQMNLPFTAANGTILMEIYEAHPNFRAVNRSVIIEQFVDATLRKAAAEQVRRETFDYGNKTSLLANIAAWMSRNDNYKPDYEDVRQYIIHYLDELGLVASVDDLLREFFVARILVRRSEGRVSFRYRSVLEYFIALQMTTSREYREWVLDEGRYLQYINEIQFYAGKLRGDEELLDLVGSRFETILFEVKQEMPELDVARIETISLVEGTDPSSIEGIATQLQSPPLSEEERDQELEAEIPRDVEDRQEVFRPKIPDLGAKLLVSLFLYSGVLKNLESVKDFQKRKHLSLALEGWSIFLNLSLIIVPEIAQKRRYKMNGVTYIVNAPLSMPDHDLCRLIALNLPTGISNWINASLGTEKLERQLIEPSLSTGKEPLIIEFFKVALIADLRLPATPSSIRNFLEISQKSKYLTESLIWKVKEIRRMNKISEEQFKRVVPHVAGAMADLKGGDRKSRTDEKSRQIQKFQRQSVILKMLRGNKDKTDD